MPSNTWLFLTPWQAEQHESLRRYQFHADVLSTIKLAQYRAQQEMMFGSTTIFTVVQPAATDRSRSYQPSWNCAMNGMTNRMDARLVARTIAWLISPRPCMSDGPTLHDQLHDHARPIWDILRFEIAVSEFWTWMTIDLAANKFARTTGVTGA